MVSNTAQNNTSTTIELTTMSDDKVVIEAPSASSHNVIQAQSGVDYVLNFPQNSVQSFTMKGSDLVVSFANGATLIIQDYTGEWLDNGIPKLTLAGSDVLTDEAFKDDASDESGSSDDARTPQAIAELEVREQTQERIFSNIEDAQENAEDKEESNAADTKSNAQNNANQVSEIEPAAGETPTNSAQTLANIQPSSGDASGTENSGFGFNSSFTPQGIIALNDVGPIDPTALAFGLPQQQDDLGLVQSTNSSPAPSLNPEIDAFDTQILEDGTQTVRLEVFPEGANGLLTVTIAGIPNTWTVTGTGTYDPGTQLWTFTSTTPGSIFFGGPTLTPPADSDVDLRDLDVTVIENDAVTGQSGTISTTIDVIVDADADDASVNGDDDNGIEGAQLDIVIDDVFTGEENNAGKVIGADDGSESITSIVIETTDGTDLNNFDIVNANGPVSLDGSGNIVFTDRSDLNGLKITPKDPNFVGDIDFKVTLNTAETPNDIEFDASNDTDSANDDFTLTWSPIAKPPTISVDGGITGNNVLEDHTKTYDVRAQLGANGSGNETLTITVTGIDLTVLEGGAAGFVPSNGPNGETWTRTNADNSNASYELKITTPATGYTGTFTFNPADDSDIDITGMQVLASAFEPATNTTANASPAHFDLIVDADADDASVNGDDDNGIEGAQLDIVIDDVFTGEENNAGKVIGADDGSESITSIVIETTDGTDLNNFDIVNANGPVSLDGSGNIVFTDRSDLNDLKITPKDTNFSGDVAFKVTLNTAETPNDIEFDASNDTDSANDRFTLSWSPVILPPTLTVGGTATDLFIKEDGTDIVDVTAALDSNAAPTEVLSITVTGIDLDTLEGGAAGFVPSNGPNGETWTLDSVDANNVATYTIKLQPGSNYTGTFGFTPKANSDVDIGTLQFTATATDASVTPTITSSTSDTFFVGVDAVADPVDIAATGGSAEEGTPIAVDIDGFPSLDTDGSEDITGYEVRGDANEMAGFTFTVNGTPRPPVAGVITLAPSEIDGLVITPNLNSYTGTLNLTAYIFNTDTPTDLENATGDNQSSDFANFSVTWTDNDQPIINDTTGRVDESDMNPNDVATGTIAVNFGDDTANATITGAGTSNIGTITSNGQPVNVNYNPANATYTGTAGGNDVFTLVIQNNGDYTFTLLGTLDHPIAGDNSAGEHDDVITLSFGVQAKDTDGDTNNANIIINVYDDGPQAVADSVSFDIDDGSVAGNVLNNDIFSKDVTNTVTQIRVTGGTFIDVPAGGSKTIASTYGDLTIHSDGSYSFNVNAASAGLNGFDQLFEYKLSDGDKDFSIAQLKISADGDDTPIDVKTEKLIVDETDIDHAAPIGKDVASGTVTADFGADNPGTFEVGNPSNVTFTGTKDTNKITSNGIDVIITAAGNKYIGQAGNVKIFELQINGNGDYTFTLLEQLDHIDNANPDDVITLGFDVIAKDSDGDTATAKIIIDINDDGPQAVDDAVTYNTDDDGASGNVLSNDNLSEDDLNLVTSITFANQTKTIAAGSSASIDGQFGTLTMNSDGTYDYDLFDDLILSETTYHYTIVNPPGSSNAGDIKNVTANYNETTGQFDFSMTIEPRANGFTLAINNGPNPKGHDELALLYFDASGSQPVITVYNYNGTNTQTSWQDGSSAPGTQTPDRILSSLIDPSAFGSISVSTDGNGNKVFGFSLDVDVINNFVPTNGDPANWTGMQFDDLFGIWLHPVEGLSTSYDNGFLTSWNIEAQSYYDAGNKSTTKTTTHEECIEEGFSYVVTDADGDSSSADVTLKGYVPKPSTLIVGQNVDDNDQSTTPWLIGGDEGVITGLIGDDILIGDAGGSTLIPQTQDYNVLFMLDISGSMGTLSDPNSRLSLLVEAVENLLSDFANYQSGDVKVHFAPFSSDAIPGSTFTLTNGSELAQAIAYLNALQSSGTTNYEAALQNGISWLQSNELIPGAQTISYFISDDQPNRYVDTAGQRTYGTEAEVIDEITGVSDTSNEVALLQSLSDEVIGVGIELGVALTSLNIIDSNGNALDIDDAQDLNSLLQETSPIKRLNATGEDVIEGNTGDDLIFGDTVNTDALATLQGLVTDTGAGWEVFERLENGEGTTANWDREDTITYINDNAETLGTESMNVQGGRNGGADTIKGGNGDDTIFAQEGNDIIVGGQGSDTLYGGSGNDIFLFEAANDGLDTIKDFVIGEDILDVTGLIGGFTDLQDAINHFVFQTQSAGGNTTVSVDIDGDTGAATAVDFAVLEGVTVTNIEDVLKTGTVV